MRILRTFPRLCERDQRKRNEKLELRYSGTRAHDVHDLET